MPKWKNSNWKKIFKKPKLAHFPTRFSHYQTYPTSSHCNIFFIRTKLLSRDFSSEFFRQLWSERLNWQSVVKETKLTRFETFFRQGSHSKGCSVTATSCYVGNKSLFVTMFKKSEISVERLKKFWALNKIFHSDIGTRRYLMKWLWDYEVWVLKKRRCAFAAFT